MKNRKIGVVVMLVLLALCSVLLYPGIAGSGEGTGKGKSPVKQVEVLEWMVEDLMDRVEALEEGNGCSCSNSFEVVHFEPLNDFPSDPLEGDVCVVGPIEGETGFSYLYVYLDGTWWRLGGRTGRDDINDRIDDIDPDA